MQIVEIIGSLLYLVSKYFLSKNKLIGWLLGVFGAISSAYLSWVNDLYFWFMIELFGVVLFTYGLVTFHKQAKEQFVKTFAGGVLAIVVILFGIRSYIEGFELSHFVEFLMSACFLIGTILISAQKKFGWLLYLIGHIILSYITFSSSLLFMGILQVISAGIAFKTFLVNK